MSYKSQSGGQPVEQPILSNGLQSSAFRYASVARDRGYHYLFLSSEKGYIARGYKFYPNWSYSLKDEVTGRSTLDAFKALLKLARDEHVELFLFLSPAHARHWETIRVTGLQPQFEEWKRGLIGVLEEDSSAHPNERQNVLWDFSGYNSISTEAIPSIDNREESMSWFWDSAHYKKELGDIILDKIFGYHDKSRENPNDFGVVLNSNNIEENIHMFNEGQKIYHQTNQLDVLEIENIAKTLQNSSL